MAVISVLTAQVLARSLDGGVEWTWNNKSSATGCTAFPLPEKQGFVNQNITTIFVFECNIEYLKSIFTFVYSQYLIKTGVPGHTVFAFGGNTLVLINGCGASSKDSIYIVFL